MDVRVPNEIWKCCKRENTVDTYDLLFLWSLFSDSIYLTLFLFNEQMANVNTINILNYRITCYEIIPNQLVNWNLVSDIRRYDINDDCNATNIYTDD